MVAMIAPVATLIHIYSVGYMAHERRSFRFFAYLSLFSFAMLMLVTANNLVQLFFGWEGVGLASYLLIGYWYDRPSANRAAMKAFIVNRVGDLFFAVGIALVFALFGSVEFPVIFSDVPQHEGALYHLFGADWRAYEVISILLFIGAMGKSAQIGLHTWLPDAMEGPTPVSALIHAATMVTAGVFLMARMSPILDTAPGGAELHPVHRRHHLHLCRHRCLRADRHQAGDRLLHLLAARLHVHLGWRHGVSGVDLPPDHPRLLQGAAVPLRRLGNPRDERRAGHAPHGRHLAEDPDHLRLPLDRQPGDSRRAILRRLLVEGRHP